MPSLAPAARLRRTALALVAVAALSAASACADSPTASNPVAGTYTATVFRVVPEGSTSALDVKAAGGTLSITIGEDYHSAGQLFIPASLVGGGADFSEAMTGTAVVNGDVLTFSQVSDTFVRDLRWTVSGRTLSVTDQLLDGDRYTIVLTR